MKDEPNLFGTTRKAKKEVQKTPSGAMHRLIGQYRAGYERRFNEPPMFTPRDSRMLKQLVLQFGEATVSERLAAYLRWDDRFAEESGYAIHVLYSSWSRLTAHVKASARRNGNVRTVEETGAALAELRRKKAAGQ